MIDPIPRLRIYIPQAHIDALALALIDGGAPGVEESAGELICYPDGEKQLQEFRSIVNGFVRRLELDKGDVKIEVEKISANYHDSWLAALTPEKITDTYTLRPTHCAPAPPHEATIWFEAQASFGSGEHATTRLASQFVEDFIQAAPKTTCLDVGTGTGVLSLVAAKSGATEIVAVDIDEISVQAARKNSELNHESSNISCSQGSAASVESSFQLVLANINTPILRDIAPALAARVCPQGSLMLTGLLDEDIHELECIFNGLGLSKVAERQSAPWSLLHLRRA